jgi:hypothetical protein
MNGLLSPNSAQNRIFLFSKFFETQSSADGPVGASSLPARPMEAPYPQSSTFQSADQPLRVWSALPGFGALKVGNSVGSSSLPARPMEGFKIGRVAFARRPGSRFPAEKAKSRLACKASPTESQSSNLLQLHLKLSSNIP